MGFVRVALTTAAAAALGASTLGGAAHAATTVPPASPCTAVPAGLALVTAGHAGVGRAAADGYSPFTTPATPGPVRLAVRGPDGTAWLGVEETDADAETGVSPSVYRLATDGTLTPSSTGQARLSSIGWADGRTAAVIVDDDAERAGTDDVDSRGAVLLEYADGEQVDVAAAGGPEYGVGSMTLGAGRLVESAWADLTEVISFRDLDGNRIEDWFSPTTDVEYNAPPLYELAIAATSTPPGGTADTRLSWIEGPDWDATTETIVGGWTLVVADPVSGAESLRLDLATGDEWLLHADFDGQFWVGTFASDVAADAVPTEPARVAVVDTRAAAPALVDAGCAAGTAATIDRHGLAQPSFPPFPPFPATTVAPPAATAAPGAAPCTYVAADDAYPLRRCDKGPAVQAIQEQLQSHAYELDADGYFGPATEAAVRDFQSANGLEVDGLVGPATWAAVYTGTPAGTDVDGSGQVDPWEVGASAGGGGFDEAALIGYTFTIEPSTQTVVGPDEATAAGLEWYGGWVVSDAAALPIFLGDYVVVNGSPMLWLSRSDVRNPDGTLAPATVLDAIDVPLASGQELAFGECMADGIVNPAVAAIVQPGDVNEAGHLVAHRAWRLDPASGQIGEIVDATVECFVVGD